jgi:hypothetical protein
MSDPKQTPDEIEAVNPWTDIWVRPRQTIDWITDNYSSLLITLILIYLGGVCFGIAQAELNRYGDSMSVGTIMALAIFLSGFGGLLTYNLWI